MQEIMTVPHVDIDRYLGIWFEICRLPLKWEDEGASDITATYTLNEDGSIHVDNRCLDEDGKPSQAIGKAVAQDATNSKLSVSFLPEYLRWIPFTKGDYWILKLDENYQTALVGTPDRDNLWLLDRNHVMDSRKRDEYLSFASGLGFDLKPLITPSQSGVPVKILEN